MNEKFEKALEVILLLQLGGKCESLVLQSVSDAVKIKDMQEKVTNLEAELNDRISNDDVKYMVHMQETMERNYDKLFKEYHDLKSDFFKINQENFNMKRKIKNKDTIIRNLEIDEEEIDRLKAEVAEGIDIENQLFDGYFKLISEYAKQSIFLEDVLAENKTLKADLEAHRPFRNVAAFEPF